MIFKTSKHDREFLKEQLLKLIKGNECYLSEASDEEIRIGTNTFYEDISVNRELIKRAMGEIQDAITKRKGEDERKKGEDKRKDNHLNAERNSYLNREREEKKLDSIGPELLNHYDEPELPPWQRP